MFTGTLLFLAVIVICLDCVMQISVWMNIISFHSFSEITFEGTYDVSTSCLVSYSDSFDKLVGDAAMS